MEEQAANNTNEDVGNKAGATPNGQANGGGFGGGLNAFGKKMGFGRAPGRERTDDEI